MGSGDDRSESEEPTGLHRGPACALRSGSEKVAVLFGNDNYDEPAAKLGCCESDVQVDVAALMPKFHDAGFLPMLSCDVSGEEFWKCIDRARRYIGGKTNVVVFHWSGHGQYDDRTWLLTTDGKRIDLHEALQKLLDKAAISVTTFVILDCCRNSPAIAPSGSGVFEGSIEREKQSGVLWQEKCEEMYVNAPQGHGPQRRKFVFFFTPGLEEPAREVKSGRHGALTRAVHEHLFKEGDLLTIIDEIKSQVQRDTKQHQLSWISSNTVEICNLIPLNPCCFKVVSAASEKIRECRACMDKQRKLTEDYARQIMEMNEKRKVEGSHRDADDEPLPTGLQSNPSRSPSLQPSSRASNSSTCCSYQQEKAGRKFWIAIDGNIGVGKTSLLRMDRFAMEIMPNVETLPEPVEKWSLGPLQKIYNSASSASDIFEAQIQIWHHFQGMADKYERLPDNGSAFLTERSPASVLKIFCQNFLDTGRITSDHLEIFRSYFRLLQQRGSLPTHHVLLEASVATCQERIKSRQRNTEQAVPGEYLESIQALLDEVYQQVERDGGTVIRIDASQPKEVVKGAFLKAMRTLW